MADDVVLMKLIESKLMGSESSARVIFYGMVKKSPGLMPGFLHGETADAEEIRAYCSEQVAHYKVPKYITILEEFPMTVTGKNPEIYHA